MRKKVQKTCKIIRGVVLLIHDFVMKFMQKSYKKKKKTYKKTLKQTNKNNKNTFLESKQKHFLIKTFNFDNYTMRGEKKNINNESLLSL